MSSSNMTAPSIKRVRFSPDVKDPDDVSSSLQPAVLPKTPRHAAVSMGTYGYPPSPPLSDSSLTSEADCFLHQLLLCRPGGFNLVFDVRLKPSKGFVPSTDGTALPLTQYFQVPATQPLLRRVQLISRHFDWRIVVENPKGITIGDVLYRIRDTLNKNVSKEEYNSVVGDAQLEVIKAYQRNCAAISNGTKLRDLQEGVKRVDWLGKRTLFAGIQKDEAFISRRIRSHSERAETFVVEFSPSQR